ncbi:diguanylate cyclase (GGDEF)-like protein [Saccharothrix coeruleofusca]|uniref:diguanylate cyclase n=1 Tax=Saccharothrix coeruleofusca TaxID=33919 RepID=UPI0027DD6CA2|nr:diguanylate cyclase [Saccharothrix coeruleofusca]MBP2335108.1 diguanylate cyclase (GGDEF)-like protein [Saccharothrix coeruleofusca]
MALYYALPVPAGGVPSRVLVYCAVSASAAVAVWWGVVRHRPRPRAAWVLLGLSQAVYALADTAFYTAHYVFGQTRYPFVADVLYLAHYPLVVAGLVVLVRARRSGRDLAGLLDAASLTVVAALLSWVFVLGPQTRLGTSPLVEAASVAYPLMDLVLLLVALCLVFGSGPRGAPFVLLTGWLAAILTADTAYVLQRLAGTYEAGNFLDAVWLAGNLALGACALHPAMSGLGLPAEAPEPRLSAPRLALPSAGALVGPAVLLVEHAKGEWRDVPVIAACCAVLFALGAARLAGMAVDQRRLATTDSLTLLRSRRYFEARLADDVAAARRSGVPLGVVILDVDRFKSVNDRFGHPAGDRVLVEVADRLRAVAGPGAVLARYGGEEFAVVVTGPQAEDPSGLAERLRDGVSRRPVRLDDRTSITVTVSAGTAVFEPRHDSAQALVSAADRALYLAKGSGRDRVVAGGAVSPEDPLGGYLDQVADLVDLRLACPGRSLAIAEWARTVAGHLDLPPARVRTAGRAGRLLDVGLAVLPEELLVRPGPLTEREWELLRAHPDSGARLVAVLPEEGEVVAAIRGHHERWDGSGYPEGLAGEEIGVEARVLAVCDAWAAMRADHPYRGALSREQAVAELRAGRGTQFDPRLVDVFLDLVERGAVGDLAAGLALTRPV